MAPAHVAEPVARAQVRPLDVPVDAREQVGGAQLQGHAQTPSLARALELLELLRDLHQPPVHARELLAHAPDVRAGGEVEQVQAALGHAFDRTGQPSRPRFSSATTSKYASLCTAASTGPPTARSTRSTSLNQRGWAAMAPAYTELT